MTPLHPLTLNHFPSIKRSTHAVTAPALFPHQPSPPSLSLSGTTNAFCSLPTRCKQPLEICALLGPDTRWCDAEDKVGRHCMTECPVFAWSVGPIPFVFLSNFFWMERNQHASFTLMSPGPHLTWHALLLWNQALPLASSPACSSS